MRFYSITTSKRVIKHTKLLHENNSLLYFDNSKLSAIMSKLLLLKVKMRRIDIPVSEIGRHFQTFSVVDEGLGGDDLFLCGSTLSINSLFWKKTQSRG